MKCISMYIGDDDDILRVQISIRKTMLRNLWLINMDESKIFAIM